MIAVRAIAVIFTFYAPAIFSGGCPGYDAMPGHCERTHRFLFPVRHPDSLNTDYIPSSVTIPIRATALATLNLSFNFSIRLLTAGSESLQSLWLFCRILIHEEFRYRVLLKLYCCRIFFRDQNNLSADMLNYRCQG